MLKQVANYRDAMTAISQFPLSQKIRVADINLTRGVVQSAYKEIKELGFKGKLTIIDYLCWVSANWFFQQLHIYMLRSFNDPLLKNKNDTPSKIFLLIGLVDEDNAADTRNIIRLWRSNPKLVEDMFDEIVMKDIKIDKKVDFFQAVADLYKFFKLE